MSLFKKKKAGNIRERKLPFDEEEDEKPVGDVSGGFGLTSNNGSFTNAIKKEKKKSKEKRIAVNALSFEDELEADDGIAFQEKKSVLSYKLRREMKKERKEKKKEEKDKFRDKPSLKGGIAELSEMGIKIVNGREAEAIAHQPGDSDDDDEVVDIKSSKESQHEFQLHRNATRDLKDVGRLTATSRHNRHSTLDPLKNILKSGQIPDANVIHMIRKQRQQAREMADYIPVDKGAEREEVKVSHKPGGRLIREEDNDRDEDDGGGGGDGRLHFSDVHSGTGGASAGTSLSEVKAMVAVGRVHQGSDEEDRVWETQQMKKAAGKLGEMELDASSRPGFTFGPAPSIPSFTSSAAAVTNAINNGSTGALLPSNSTPTPTTLMAATALLSSRPGANYQAEGIMKRLRDSRNSLAEVHRRHALDRDALRVEHEECVEGVRLCEQKKAELAQTFQLYQALRGYVTDLRECLNEKMVGIEDLEQRVLTLYKQRTDKLLARRRQDVTDQNDEVSPFISESLKQCPLRTRRGAEREGRRTRRRREREKRGGSAAQDHHDGTSTDDELPTQQLQQYQQQLEALSKESVELFSDVEEDFCSLEAVLRQFEKWRRAAPQAYADAYAANNMPALVGVFIRLELLLWNPLSEGVEIERQAWYAQLAMYAAPPASAALTLQEFAQDPDKHLLSRVVEKVVLVKLRDVVVAYWDPLSHSQSVRLVNLVRHFCQSCPTIRPTSQPLKKLCTAVVDKIRQAIDKDVFIPIFNKTAYESRTSSGSLFFQRQFWVAWKLLSLVLMWHKILSENSISDLGIRSILNLYLIPALNIAAQVNLKDGLEKAKYVIQAMPREWAKQENSDGSAHIFLSKLEHFLASTAQKTADIAYTNDPHWDDALQEIRKLLKSIGASRAASEISAKYLTKKEKSED
ncbi:PAX3- and PAX7-binding protein 1 [Hyalella azteca]|uniref:PAX3- and PAX7-binding protein 1 n=1 Tax=Hyalella azteca TaxID=294128 RepID=A0A8B7PB60_HYAAZ|nr:PAX3- and PAX7-binding protein 1 [Hyalella azteca]